MEAATERINSASWREKFHSTCNSYPTNGRSERRIVGAGAEILYQPPRYYDIGSEDAIHQDGGPKEYLRKWSRGSSADAFQQGHVLAHQAKDSESSLAEYLLIETTEQNLESSLPKEILLSQYKDEIFLTSASRSVCPPHPQDDKVLLQSSATTDDDNLRPHFQGELSPAPRSVKSERLSPANLCSQIKSEDSFQSATTSPGLTTELENFQDLTAWCRLAASKSFKMSVPLETDELNTPVIEFGDFIFQSPSIDHQSNNDNCYYGLLNVQNELLHSSSNPDGLYIQNDAFDIQINKNDNNNIISCQLFGQSNYNNNHNSINKDKNDDDEQSYQYLINNIGGGESKKQNTKTTLMDDSIINNNIFTTKCADNIYNSEEFQSQQLPNNVFALAQDPPVFELSESAISTQQENDDIIVLPLEDETVVANTNNNKKNLQLDFSNLWTTTTDKLTPTVIDTPEVINTALAMQDKTFNLINFITNESLKDTSSSIQSSSEAQFEEESRSTSTNDPDPSYTTPSEASDDEDYEPPTKKKPSTSRSPNKRTPSKKFLDISDSDLSNMSSTIEAAQTTMKVVRRGRPPKRNVSISSESTNADNNDVSRYRELRDKNNEASRRSRFNRKMKEISLEQEAEDLDVRNRKLKVQVQEMERQVNSLRQNLMQMLLKK